MKQLLVQYATYNHWANKRFADVIVNLSDEQLNQEINSSFKSIFRTFLHLWDMESVWWQRMKLSEHVEFPGKTFDGTIIEVANNLLKQSKQWKEWVDIATEAALVHAFSYHNSKKQKFTQPVYEMLIHIFDHQTYHRGQLMTMLRQAGITHDLPVTGFIEFARKK